MFLDKPILSVSHDFHDHDKDSYLGSQVVLQLTRYIDITIADYTFNGLGFYLVNDDLDIALDFNSNDLDSVNNYFRNMASHYNWSFILNRKLEF